jgi:hypothetical protein
MPVSAGTPTVNVSTTHKLNTATVKQLAIGALPSAQGKLGESGVD